jgi:hypothetical protein
MLDVDATTDVVVAGRTFRVSGIPAGIAHGLDFRSTKALAPLREHIGADGKPLPGHEDAIAAVQVMVDAEWLETAREWIRWGLRSYASAAGGKTVRQLGRDWVLLSDEACERIVRAEGGFLALGLAREIAAKQRVSADEALGFLSPSGSA